MRGGAMRAEGMGIKGFVWGTARSVLILEVFSNLNDFSIVAARDGAKPGAELSPGPTFC